MVRIHFLVFALGFIFNICESKPLSSSACACTSGCAKSGLLHLADDFGKFEWCNVALTCQSQGWDWCHDTASLYHTVKQQKEHAEQQTISEHGMRADAESQAVKLQTQLAETQRQLKDAVRNKAALADALIKSKRTEEKLEKETQLVKQEKLFADAKARGAVAERKQVEAAQVKSAAQVKAAKEETEKVSKDLTQTKLRLSDTEKKRQDAESKTKNVQDSLDAAKDKQAETDWKLKDAKQKSREDAAEAQNFKAAVKKGVLKLKAGKKSELATAAQKQSETEKKLEASERKAREIETQRADLASKIDDARSQKQLAEKNMKDAQVGQQNAEIRTFRLAVRGAVRGGTGVVKKDGTVEHWRIR